MRTELARMRDLLRTALPERAFLRRDRGDALFISNAPAFGGDPESIPGFTLERSGGLLRILPDASWITQLEENAPEPPDELCRSLARFRGMRADEANIRLFCEGLKLLDVGGSLPKNEITAYDRAVRQRAAVALRGGCGGGLYAIAIINCDLSKEENEI